MMTKNGSNPIKKWAACRMAFQHAAWEKIFVCFAGKTKNNNNGNGARRNWMNYPYIMYMESRIE